MTPGSIGSDLLKRAICLVLSASLTVACATQQELAKKSDYKMARESFSKGEYKKASRNLPSKEKGGFISSSESLWTEWLYSEPDPWAYQKLAASLDSRKVIYVSQEAENFFYRETEEGYFPAEHEIVFFHILLGYAFAKREDRTGACVEAHRASEYLQDSFDERRQKFDDPGLRMWLAGLWIYCGDWEHAQVDIRVAGQLLNRKDLIKVSEQDTPPKHLHIGLLGEGPEILWKADLDKRGTKDLNKIEFKLKDFSKLKFNLVNSKPEGVAPEAIVVKTDHGFWYARHLKRNTQIRETLSESKYMIASMGSSAKAAIHIGVAAAAAASVITAGVVIGGLLIGGTLYLLISVGAKCDSGCGEIVGAIMLGGWAIIQNTTDSAEKMFKSENREANDRLTQELDISNTYRFVRFLPNAMVFAIENQEFKSAGILENDLGVKVEHEPLFSFENQNLNSKVHIYQWTP